MFDIATPAAVSSSRLTVPDDGAQVPAGGAAGSDKPTTSDRVAPPPVLQGR